MSVVRVAPPSVVYFGIIFLVVLLNMRRYGFSYRVSCTHGMVTANNNFKLAIAFAIAKSSLDSNQAPAVIVGPLVEALVLLALDYVAKWCGFGS